MNKKFELTDESKVNEFGEILYRWVFETWHCLAVSSIGSQNITATLYRTRKGEHNLNVGCWDGTLDTLMKEVKRRRADWTADEATQELWVEQYRALKMLGIDEEHGTPGYSDTDERYGRPEPRNPYLYERYGRPELRNQYREETE